MCAGLVLLVLGFCNLPHDALDGGPVHMVTDDVCEQTWRLCQVPKVCQLAKTLDVTWQVRTGWFQRCHGPEQRCEQAQSNAASAATLVLSKRSTAYMQQEV